MKALAQYLVENIVNHAEDVEVVESPLEEGSDATLLTIHVHPEDMGVLIGKSGKTIRAIREVVKILATKQSKYVEVEIAEDKEKDEEDTENS